MPITLALDIYDTLINISHIARHLEGHCGQDAAAFAYAWRSKKLEYTLRRGLMRRYDSYHICSRDALDHVSHHFHVDISDDDKEKLIGNLNTLPLYDDVPEPLSNLHSDKHRIFALTNAARDNVWALLEHNGIAHYFEDVVSADEIETYKPDPDLFLHFLERSGATADGTVYVAGNPYEVAGASSCGLNAIYIKRPGPEMFDPWEQQPEITVKSFTDIENNIRQFNQS